MSFKYDNPVATKKIIFGTLITFFEWVALSIEVHIQLAYKLHLHETDIVDRYNTKV
jgi:hypothetical protein